MSTLPLLAPYIGPHYAQPAPRIADVYIASTNAAVTAQPLLGFNAARGMFLVFTSCAVLASAGSAGTITLQVNCAGEDGNANTYTMPALDAQTVAMNTAIFNVSSNGSGDITYQVGFTGIVTVGSLSYTYRVTAVQITNLT